MNEPSPASPLPTPPALPPGLASTPPLGTHPEEQVPIVSLVAVAEALLRQPRRVMFQLRQAQQTHLTALLMLIAIICALVYGFVVGTFSGGEQLWAAPIKIAAGLVLSALICLPSLYIFSCLSGSQARFADVCGLVAGLLTLMMVLLIGFVPVAWVFSQSTESVPAMGALHLVFWLIATYFGLRFLYAGLTQFKSESSDSLKVWIIIFLLVTLQMTTALRPLVGQADTFFPVEKKFFVSHWADCLKQ
ncbi:MAG: hypothetical protein HY674_07125 [Chloroflexi bacterium]|nr:hypothetical protein [Chloroflexota bacterium]